MAAIAWEAFLHYQNWEGWTKKKRKKQKVRNLTKPENAHENSTVPRGKNLSVQNLLL